MTDNINLVELNKEDAVKAINSIDNVESAREVAKANGITFSGNTGLDTLKSKLLEAADTMCVSTETEKPSNVNDILNAGADEPIEVAKVVSRGPSTKELIDMDPTKIDDPSLRRQVIRAQALRLVRVRIQNLDPADVEVPGAIITVANKYIGKVTKYIPYGDESENGYHIPMVIYNHLKNQKFVMRKLLKQTNFGVKKYKTIHSPKFSLEILKQLTSDELKVLAGQQKANQAIDKD